MRVLESPARVTSWAKRSLLFGVLLIGGANGSTLLLAADPAAVPDVQRQVDSQTVMDPLLELEPPVLVWPVDLRPIWRASLEHPESELRAQVADLIRQAHRYGMPDLVELQEALRGVLETAGEQPATRTAAAAALVELGCRESAPLLAAQATAGPLQLQLVVERGLAQWDYQPARELWLARLRDRSANGELVRVAAESLATVGDARAIQPLSEMLLSPVESRVDRLVAARALAALDAGDALPWSRRLLAGISPDSIFDAQLGVELLTQQSSPAAVELLQQYARSAAPTVAAVALRRLLQLDPSHVLARAETTIRDADANVRGITIEALTTDPTTRSIELLSAALDDPVPQLRRRARHALLHFAAEESLRQPVIEHAVQLLGSESWRSLENALIVLTELEHVDAKGSLLPLIDHQRSEVQITAAWAMKHLYDPADAPIVLETVQRVTAEIDAAGPTERSHVQLHLCEALGLLKYQPGVEFLTKLLPKQAPYAVGSRAAALWALGFLLDPSKDTALIRSLEARLADADSVPMEFSEVRAAAAIALGRIADEDSLPVLRRWYKVEGPSTAIGRSCGWAILQMTGEPIPEPEPRLQSLTDWIIEPLGAK